MDSRPVQALHDPARHESLAGLDWRPARARDAIAAICRDAEAAFDRDRLWPLHPADDDPSSPDDGVLRGLYVGAAGMLHALGRLAEAGLHAPTLDGAAIAGGLHEAALASPDEAGAGASLLLGSSGTLLVAHRLAPSAATADAIAANVEHPSNELLLGAPGTMLAARAMHARTGEERFAELWRASARTLLARQEADGLWTQGLYGDRLRYVGAGHGFAGNVLALRGALQWLDDAAAVEARAVATVRALAIVDGAHASWPPLAEAPRPARCRACSGATAPRASSPPSPRSRPATTRTARCWPPAANSSGGRGRSRATPGCATGRPGTASRSWRCSSARATSAGSRGRAPSRCTPSTRSRASARPTAAGATAPFTGDAGAALLAAACLSGAAAFPGLDDL